MKENKSNEPSLSSLTDKSKELEKELQSLRKSTTQLAETVQAKEQKMAKFQRSKLLKCLDPRQVKQSLRKVAAYLVGKRNLKRLYSRSYKRKQASNDLIPYVRLLYEEGFTEKALKDLQDLYEITPDKYTSQAIAQELALYYANKETEEAAEIALLYIEVAKKNERDKTISQQLAIIEAECLLVLGKTARAQQILHQQLQVKPDRNLYLALANTETSLDRRLYWLNETMKKAERQPIIFEATDDSQPKMTYDILHETRTAGTEVSGPMISVILPAYNAADSIHIAIESMLNQTWTNIELLIVDDCSKDNTYQVMEAYAKKDERIKLFQTPVNSGPYVARNIALKAAQGEFVTVNDADDWSHREKLAVQAAHLLESPQVIANTSELARLTSDFIFHRRGTRGKYIFSNMSSLLFRRKEVVERIGYWDEVRFAADGEFKRRLVQEFGKNAIVDLRTGPLSLPEQSRGSLTGSSAFGYAGFFMGARKEYVDSFSNYHQVAENLYYPKEPANRLFPVPEPMLPESNRKERHLDLIIVANFYDMPTKRLEMIVKEIEINKEKNLSTGLLQMYDYNNHVKKRKFNKKIRNIIDGNHVEMIVYGEKINTEIVLVHSPESLQEKQQYIAKINNRITVVIIDELPKVTYNSKEKINYNLRQMIRQTSNSFSEELRIYPLDNSIRHTLETKHKRELGNLKLASNNWLSDDGNEEGEYKKRLENWLIEENDYKLH